MVFGVPERYIYRKPEIIPLCCLRLWIDPMPNMEELNMLKGAKLCSLSIVPIIDLGHGFQQKPTNNFTADGQIESQP